jgi:hypothetical protein
MRASRGGSLALPAFLGPTHENLFLTSTLPPFLAESGQEVGPIWGIGAQREAAARIGHAMEAARRPFPAGHWLYFGQPID